ncbi:serine O-acetyltransferase [Geodermatophilus sabuli]|uniref:Serine acetyltransferase n=1 Tax=Geodermatophilus sabuli TaxID=1564158 RepID=A0A285EJN3_9ACTN|nr:serine acetyltransferase [Geodermatophilus sabuli]MBB3083216.1 serine acetyltransferase [Geodermatophilus sabuli]SNX98211.1 serine O-acetyltransferase [Geodermatophilus sabuli]
MPAETRDRPGRPGLFQDWPANRGRPGIQLVLVLFRLAQRARGGGGVPRRLLAAPLMLLYRVVALRFFGIDLPVSTAVGRGLAVHHGMGLVVNRATRIGDHVTLRHTTTLGSRRTDADCPELASHVDVGPHSVLLGAISVGRGAVIGAGSVVLQDVPPAASVAGNPARVLSTREVTPC